MLQRPQPRLVLASASPSRRALLTAAGLRFEVRPARVDEAEVKRVARAEGASAENAALALADLKARQVAQTEPDAVIVGADQILVCEGAWFDKPGTLEDAAAQLRTLRGKSHTLVTAVTCWKGDQLLWQHVARPHLLMRQFSDAFLAAYLAAEAEAVLSSVGAYRLEALGVHLFAQVEGEHAAILGLPLLPLFGFLRQHGVLME